MRFVGFTETVQKPTLLASPFAKGPHHLRKVLVFKLFREIPGRHRFRFKKLVAGRHGNSTKTNTFEQWRGRENRRAISQANFPSDRAPDILKKSHPVAPGGRWKDANRPRRSAIKAIAKIGFLSSLPPAENKADS